MIKNVIVFIAAVGVAGALSASELMSSADALEGKSWDLSAYGRTVETNPRVTDFKLKENYDAVMTALAVRPRDGLTYRFKAGQVRNFDLRVPSGSSNKFEALKPGTVWGLGVNGNITQGTIVSAAIAIDLSYTRTVVPLDRFHSDAGTAVVDDSFEQDEAQAAMNISRRWKMIEPFGGVKLNWVRSKLVDHSTKESVAGNVSGVSPFVGLKWDIFDGESVIVEGSFVDERSLSAGMSVRF